MMIIISLRLDNKATKNLQEDHILIRRLGNIIKVCSDSLYKDIKIPIEDIEIISVIIEEFVDGFHHGKEEQAYFPETQDKDNYTKDIRKFIIEHEFGRRIAIMLRRETNRWKNEEIYTTEPIARFLRTYYLFIFDHTMKEDIFFDLVTTHNNISDKEDEKLLKHYESCTNILGGEERIKQTIKLMEYLENRVWMPKSP
jgi:hemerythrin-like domain-containing protein